MTTILLAEEHEEVWEMLSRRLRHRGLDVSIDFSRVSLQIEAALTSEPRRTAAK